MLEKVKRQPVVEASGVLEKEGMDYLSERGISRRAADFAGVFSGKRWFRKLGEESAALCFPYRSDGNVYAVKYRSIEAKDFSCQNAPETLWRSDLIPDDAKDIIITEGEMDTLSLIEAGFENAVSVPSGAPMVARNDKITPAEDRKYRFIWNSTDIFDRMDKVIIASDCDGPGEALAEEIARRVGKDKCWQINIPDDCKDLNDILRRHGPAALQNTINNAIPWPVAGLYSAGKYEKDVQALFDKGMAKGYITGLNCLDEYYSVMPGQFTVVTGAPGSGKSELLDMIMVNLAEIFGWKFAICSFENPPPMHISKLVEKRVRKSFHVGVNDRMTRDERDVGMEWVNDHFMFIEQADGAPSTIDSILERAKVAVRRYGVRGVVIDPYNYIESDGNSNETREISDMLTKVRRFAVAHDVHLWFVAHPAKLYRKQDGSLPVPMGYDISGCHDEETEVLTNFGWVPHRDVTMETKVACFDPSTMQMSYDYPQVVHAYDYEGVMHHWRGRGTDLLVTPNHRMVAHAERKNDPFDFIESKDMVGAGYRIPCSVMPLEGEDLSKIDIDLGYNAADLMWFIGFWVAEGCVSMNSLSVCQAEDAHEKPKRVMDRLGLVYTDVINDGRFREKRMWVARLHRQWHIDLIDTVIRDCGEGCANKKIPDWLWKLSPRLKESFLDGFWYGDGSSKRESKTGHTTSRQLADDLMRLCLECGYRVRGRADYTKNEKWLDRYEVAWMRKRGHSLRISRNFEEVPYSGKVYCLTVPTGAYITRRNMRVAMTGNSSHWVNKADMGMTVHQNVDTGYVDVHMWKVRFKWLGKRGCCQLTYDVVTGRYSDSTFEDDLKQIESAMRFDSKWV